MKNTLLLFSILISVTSCYQNSDPNLKDFKFLLGEWERSNDQAGFKTFENWKIGVADNYLGFGYTLQGEDTVFKEYMQILWIDSAFYLKVEGPNEQPTLFYVDKKSSTEFRCINEENEFPKNIAYSLQNDVLTAIISDDSNEVKFTFQRQ